MLTAAAISPASITFNTSNDVLAFTAAELREHLERVSAAGSVGIALECGTGRTDGFEVSVSSEGVRVRGDSPRGVLNGAYWLLERLGFAWVEPGERGAVFAPGRSLAEGEYRESPSFERRTLILGQDALHDDWLAWTEWASRNRYNDIFFHDTPPSVWDRGGKPRPATAEDLDADRKGWMFERWDTDGRQIVEEARRRGLTLQFGGHHLPTLVPREEFDRHPEWFPVRRGARDPKYNLCTATPELREYLARRTEAFVARFPGADVYHVWGDDIRGGGWCECATCGRLSPSDQALLATNLVAEALARIAPSAKVAHLAYHDTLEPPAIEPLENVTALYAPRERCYAHAIADFGCERNGREYWEPFMRFAGLFPAGRMQVFEYYSDAILFKGLAPTHLAVLPKDAGAYREAGVWNMGNLMVGDRPWVGPPWHAWWTAKCLWDANADSSRELAAFCDGAFGKASAQAYQQYRNAEAVYRDVLDLHDLQPLPRHDVLDFSDTPRETLGQKAEELRRSGSALAEIAARLPATDRRMTEEGIQARFVSLVVRHLAHRLTAWDHACRGEREAAMSNLDQAEAALADIHAWDMQHNTTAYAVIARPMRRAMAWHTAEIRRSLGSG